MVDQEELYQTVHKDKIGLNREYFVSVPLGFNASDLISSRNGFKRNHAKKKTEVNRQLTESEEYQTREKNIEKIDTDIQKNKIEQEYLRNMIAVNREYIGSE